MMIKWFIYVRHCITSAFFSLVRISLIDLFSQRETNTNATGTIFISSIDNFLLIFFFAFVPNRFSIRYVDMCLRYILNKLFLHKHSLHFNFLQNVAILYAINSANEKVIDDHSSLNFLFVNIHEIAK